MKKTLLTLLAAVVVASGYASASELHGTQLACNDKVTTASVKLASADESTTHAQSTTSLESTRTDSMASAEQSSKDQADTEDEGSGSAEPAARAEARGERPQVDDESLWAPSPE